MVQLARSLPKIRSVVRNVFVSGTEKENFIQPTVRYENCDHPTPGSTSNEEYINCIAY